VVLPGVYHWVAFLAAIGGILLLVLPRDRDGRLAHLRLAVLSLGLMAAAGCATIWIKSAFLGTPPLPRPMLAVIEGTVVDRQVQAAQGRVRLTLATQIALPSGEIRAGQVRINVPLAPGESRLVGAAAGDGARLRLRARLMPPAPPMVPGGFDFARTAWFSGLMATGSSVGPITVVAPAPPGTRLDAVRQRLADHIRAQLGGSPGAIAAAFASGDRGSIARTDEDAMRDAGLTHLLSISGLHVSAVVGAVYLITARLLALVPFLALRLRVPLAAAAMGAVAGIGYTLLTGAEVPTIRSCLGALLVLLALALGRDPLSLRMLAVAAFIVMLFWPEAVAGPSFQMSFGSVIAIIAFDSSAPVRRFLAHPLEGWPMRLLRHLGLVLMTGLVIELALMPMALFHFHRAGIYGAAANVVAIPLTTFVTMPLIALALFLDLAGWGAPAWWAVGKSLDGLLWLAHVTASQPGAVTLMPGMPGWVFGLLVAGLLWLALWTGRVRLWGFVPIILGVVLTLAQPTPDLLVTGDGHHVGLAGEGPDLLMLRDTRSDYTPAMLLENAGLEGAVRSLDTWPGARCNADFCRAVLARGDRSFAVLMSRGRDRVDPQALAQACAMADIVIADRALPATCRPRWLKADRRLLRQTGGLAIYLARGKVVTVAQGEGQHGWFPAPAPWVGRPGSNQPGRCCRTAGQRP
jgi:competence protein ComEC